jgi:DNA-binding CsgD family transcriptional regulator
LPYKSTTEGKLASPNVVLGKQTGRSNVKKLRVVPKQLQQKKHGEIVSNLFVFCEKRSGVAQFRASSAADLDCTLERVSGLLAIQCLVRGQEPGDFEVMVPAEGAFVERLVTRARELLKEGRAVACPASLSPRQREVLHSVINNRANKEIASKLNITVRTVKFHISTLLSKFGVDSRAELARRATGFMSPMVLDHEPVVLDRAVGEYPRRNRERMPLTPTLQITSKLRAQAFPKAL